MSVGALYEAVFAHPGPWTEDDYFALPEMPTKVELVDLENGMNVVEATLFELTDGQHQEAARSVDGVLRSSVPWPFEADLRALAAGR